MAIKNIVFDVGAVLIDWNPRYLFRGLFGDGGAMEKFLSDVGFAEWNHSLDLGRPWEEARAEKVAQFPEYTDMIDAYWDRWIEMCDAPIHESVDILMDIKRRGYPVYALSNWNDLKWDVASKEFPFLKLFNNKIVSGHVKLAKPDPAIYQLLLDTYKLNAEECFFVDDKIENVQIAKKLGIHAVQFTSPRQLEMDLIACGVIPDDGAAAVQSGCGAGCTCHG